MPSFKILHLLFQVLKHRHWSPWKERIRMPRKVMCNHTEICFSSFQAAGKLATKAQIHNFCESRWIGVPSCVPDLERSCEGEALSVALTSGGVFSIGCGPQGCFHSPSEVKNPPAMQGTQRRGFDPWVGKIPWRRVWQPTSVFLPGKSRGQRSLMGCSPWGRKESYTTELLSRHACGPQPPWQPG